MSSRTYATRTDLAVESLNAQGTRTRGTRLGGVRLQRVTVTPDQAKPLGKAPGKYTTLQWPAKLFLDTKARDACARVAADELRALLPERRGNVLVIGLGNRRMTADALGPRSVEKVLITRHVADTQPQWLDERFGTVAAISPGVMGQTGLDTGEVVRGIVQTTHPDCVICVDALASRATARIGTTLQMTDAGLTPGSGLGNAVASLTRERLGVPCIAIGVPLVVFAQTIARDAAEALLDKDNGHLPRQLPAAVEKTAKSAFGDMVVTPKDIDYLIDELSTLIADALNGALHDEDMKVLRGIVL